MLRHLVIVLIFFSVTLPSWSNTIHIVYPDNSNRYQALAQDLSNKITRWQNNNKSLRDDIRITGIDNFSFDTTQKNDLIIDLSNSLPAGFSQTQSERSVLVSFSKSYNSSMLTKSVLNKQQAYIYIDQPVTNMLAVAEKMLKNTYKKDILIIVSETNTAALKQIKAIEDMSKIKLIVIKEGDIAAKQLNRELFSAAAIVALYDPAIWSGNSARWLLQEAYNYKVPIIGYSKAFLKAGAMASVYSSADQILQETFERTVQWIKHRQFKQAQFYPQYKVEVNRNIAKALDFSEVEIIDIGGKQ